MNVFPQGSNRPVVPLSVVDDYGPIGEGASQARSVLAENGEEYIIKGPSLVPEHPTVAANEWIAARLAETIGLPVLDHRFVTMGGEIFFASAWMQKPTFYPAIDANLFRRCENRDRVYGVVVFDTWFINQDRHGANLVVRNAKGGNHLMILNDHSHLLVSPLGPHRTEELMGWVEAPPERFIRLPFVRDSIADPAEVRAVLDRIEALSDTQIRAAVNSTPTALLAVGEQGVYGDFLVERRACLREVIHSGSAAFPNLEGAI
ncbi:MAG: HipA family kinase [Solirubrobacterales bacterium]